IKKGFLSYFQPSFFFFHCLWRSFFAFKSSKGRSGSVELISSTIFPLWSHLCEALFGPIQASKKAIQKFHKSSLSIFANTISLLTLTQFLLNINEKLHKISSRSVALHG